MIQVKMPCGACNRGAPFDGTFDVARQCRLCWLRHNDASYQALWSSEPGLLQKAVNFAGAVVSHVRAGLPQASPELKAQRLSICAGCVHFAADRQVCTHCGCNMGVKAGWGETKCPLDLW